MKKVIAGGAVFVAAVAALRRFGPTLAERCMSKCHEILDRMPEDFPPKRMMRGMEERMLHRVEKEHPERPLAAAN